MLSLRSNFLDFKLKYLEHNCFFKKDFKEKGDVEKKHLQKDMTTVDNAVQRVCSGFFFAALTAHPDWPLRLGKILKLYCFCLFFQIINGFHHFNNFFDL